MPHATKNNEYLTALTNILTAVNMMKFCQDGDVKAAGRKLDEAIATGAKVACHAMMNIPGQEPDPAVLRSIPGFNDVAGHP